MPKTKYLWWGYVKSVCRAYPQSGEGREHDAVREAVRATEALPDGETRMRVIRAVFFRQSHSLHGAALRWCGGSYADAKRIQRDFLLTAARNLGLLE